MAEGATQAPGILHRLDKADTKEGLTSLQTLADLGVPYAMMLYERFLGRPFAGHRDSVSELVGDVLEAAIETVLSDAGISFRKTKRAERVADFDQAPDFIVPDEFSPQVVIEAKITEDDGTARDKVTRVQHLGTLSMRGRQPHEPPRVEVIACIAGRGFKVRRVQDQIDLLQHKKNGSAPKGDNSLALPFSYKLACRVKVSSSYGRMWPKRAKIQKIVNNL